MNPPDNEKMLAALQQALSKKRVLIVDRHAPARESLRLMLSELGIIAVQGVGSAAEALRMVRSHRFDIILSDFILDDERDGQQLLEEMRHARLIPLATVYLIVSSERSYGNVVSLAELQPDDYLIRPFTPEQLHARLIRAAYRKHVLREIYQLIERNAANDAIAACDRIAEQEPDFLYDTLRLKGELQLQLSKNEEAELTFRLVLAARNLPWAKIGLATALREQGQIETAAALAGELIVEAPDFLAAHDFLATTLANSGHLTEAQQILQNAAELSPYNTRRLRQVGDIASRTGDLLAAEKAYNKVIERNRGSSLRQIDDFTNLSRVLIDRGELGAARRVLGDLQREWRGDKQAQMAAMIGESLCLQQEGQAEEAAAMVEQALRNQAALQREAENPLTARPLSQRIAVDLAEACYASGRDDMAERIVRQVASENHDDKQLLGQIKQIFAKTGHNDSGKSLLDQVDKQIVALNNRGVIAARSGNLQGAVTLLMQAADEAPNLQFLVNAAKAIYSLLSKESWDRELAIRADDYLRRAELKDEHNPKIAAARQLRSEAMRKHGISEIRR